MTLHQHGSTLVTGLLAGIHGLAFALLLISVLSRDAGASNYYSKQYGLPCSKCHDKIPALTGFGSSFKNNGYSFEKKVPGPKSSSASGIKSTTEPHVSAGAKGTDEKSTVDSPQDIPASQPSDGRDYLYKGLSRDGTYVFSDNPLRVPDESGVKEQGNNAGDATKKHRRSATASKPASSKTVPEKRRKAVKAAPVMRKTVAPEPAVVPQPASVPVPQPRTYEECMEKILITSDQPKNAAETMEQFEKAEQRCAPYTAPR